MFILFDCKCQNCENENEQYLKIDEEPLMCELCNGEMVKNIKTMHFKLNYNPQKDSCSWGNEGYNSSMFWKDVKEARSRGEKCKGANEV